MTDPQSGEAVRAEIVRACGPAAAPEPWTEEQLAEFTAAWEKARHGPPVLLKPLPWRARLRLAVERRVDRTAIRLVDRDRYRAAERLWRAFGLWTL